MNWSRLAVRASILAAIAGAIALFLVLSLHRREPGMPPVPGIASDR